MGGWTRKVSPVFVASYQKVTVLTLGELWAIPIMLRLALIENLRRVGSRVVAGSIDRDLAARWAEQMMEIAEKDPKSLILLTADMARSNPPMGSSFVAEFARRLQGQSTALALPLTWIEQRLSESNLTIEQLVAVGEPANGRRPGFHQQQHRKPSVPGGDGLARIRRDDERRRPELRRGPGGAYGRMDFTTRDRYRHVIEKIARRADCTEADVARQAILLGRRGSGQERSGHRTAHVGST